jgi:putative FmdB family regulatory protein
MRKAFDYRCPACNTKFDAFVNHRDEEVRCTCGTVARRIISPVRSALDPVSGAFPGAAWKWEREHERAGRKTSDMNFNE